MVLFLGFRYEIAGQIRGASKRFVPEMCISLGHQVALMRQEALDRVEVNLATGSQARGECVP